MSGMGTSLTSTPISRRISSTRYEDYAPSVKKSSLAKIMDIELKDAVYKVNALDKVVFPDNMLPFPITKKLIKAISYSVPQSRTEASMAAWLNGIADELANYTKVPVVRKWDACMKNTVVLGSNIQRKPDLVVVPKDFSTDLCDNDNRPHWKSFHAYTEVTSQSIQWRLNETTWQKSFVMFDAQPTRRFIPNLTFNDKNAILFVCDRAGVVHSKPLPLSKSKKELLRLIAGFAFAQEYVLGYDETMKGSGDAITAITINGEEFTVIKRVFRSSTMRGRATQCWHVRSADGKEYIIKDSWIDTRRQLNEIDILREISDVVNVPTLVTGWDVCLPNGKKDTTGIRWLKTHTGEERVHRRLLIEEVGEPLSTFRSKKELVGAFIDVIEGINLLSHEDMWLTR